MTYITCIRIVDGYSNTIQPELGYMYLEHVCPYGEVFDRLRQAARCTYPHSLDLVSQCLLNLPDPQLQNQGLKRHTALSRTLAAHSCDFKSLTLEAQLSLICDMCGGQYIRTHCTTHGSPEAGWMYVERCDHCAAFSDDLHAAKSRYTQVKQFNGKGVMVRVNSAIPLPLAQMQVICSICNKPAMLLQSHLIDDQWVCHERCWFHLTQETPP
jgi:hypothetical protein